MLARPTEQAHSPRVLRWSGATAALHSGAFLTVEPENGARVWEQQPCPAAGGQCGRPGDKPLAGGLARKPSVCRQEAGRRLCLGVCPRGRQAPRLHIRLPRGLPLSPASSASRAQGGQPRSLGVAPSWPSATCHRQGNGDAAIIHGLKERPRQGKMNYVSFISKKQSQSPFVIKFAVRETLLYLITSDICWLLVLETIKV